MIVAAAGRDFDSYALTLVAHGLPLDGIRRADEVFTALCYITTDMNSNQITGFYPGAMTLPAEYDFPGLDARQDLAIVSPGNVEDMRRLPRLYREKGVPYIFDPGQQLPVLTSQELLEAIEGSLACITNDYELNMICKATGKSEDEIAARTQWLVTTLGAEGAQVRGHGENIRIAPVPISKVLDPTGAGDAHRAGLIKGLVHGLAMPDAARLGSVSASFALEKLGTQEHIFTPADFCQRYEAVFGPMPKGIFAV